MTKKKSKLKVRKMDSNTLLNDGCRFVHIEQGNFFIHEGIKLCKLRHSLDITKAYFSVIKGIGAN